MKLSDFFASKESYAAGMEDWVEKYFKTVNFEMEHTFVNDFALADWDGEKEVKELYERVMKDWLAGTNYKPITEAIMSINMLAWAHDQLKKQGISGRDAFINLYSDLYYDARDKFYDYYKDNEAAKDYFFEMTD